MAFSSLSGRLSGLPRVLAGPILRRVTPTTVTVWVALREAAPSVTLTVSDDHNHPLMTGTRPTVAIGKSLHIAAVTAHPLGGFTALQAGNIYQYNLDFGNAMDLAAATNLADLAYSPYQLPSFCLPPADISSVRLFHGSCRMPHGSGPDALPLLDVLIGQAASNAAARPHQLMLTGDQIYADDVSAALLYLLTDAGDILLYGNTADAEVLPVLNKPANTLPPYWRFDALDAAGFTSDDLRSHLMSLGEYLAMYLFTWSDVLWPRDGNSTALPTDDVVNALKANNASASDKVQHQWKTHGQNEIEGETRDVKMHYATLSRVRKLLANIPTYMIFDDHEITDDWNMTLGFCKSVYSSPLGRRVIQNGLVAYALCQHWGNLPESFEKPTAGSSTQPPPGAALLDLLDGKNANDYANKAVDIQNIVGVRNQPDQRIPDPRSLIYNYTIEATAYQIIVTDTRSWRTYPDGDNATGHFLPVQPVDQFKAQISNTPNLNGRVLLIVVTTNAPPTQPIRTAGRNAWLTKKLGGSDHPDIYDAWDLPSVPFDRLLVALTEKLLDHGTRKGPVILLSGDVHHGFSSRLKYRATRRFEDTQTQPQAASVVFVQLVASSFKKQNGKTITLHKEGYIGAPWAAKNTIPPHKPEGYVGFNFPAGKVVGERDWGGAWEDIALKSAAPLVVPTIVLGVDHDDTLYAEETRVKLQEIPDYRYRLDYLEADKQGQQPIAPPSIPAFSPGMPRASAVAIFNQATSFYRDYNYKGFSKQQIIGLNNIGEVSFGEFQSNSKNINHTLRWKLQDQADFAWATYNLYVDPNDDVIYPNIKAANE